MGMLLKKTKLVGALSLFGLLVGSLFSSLGGEGAREAKGAFVTDTVTYSIAGTTSNISVSTTGSAPEGSSAAYSQTYSNGVGQMTSDNSTTLVISGYDGYTLTGLKMSMKSNASKGSGSVTVTAGSTSLYSLGATAFSSFPGQTKYSSSYVDVTFPLSNSTYVIGTGEDLKIVVAATVNSLYVQSYTLTYSIEVADKNVDHIEITSDGTAKTEYYDLEDFDSTGLTVTAYFDDESTKDVTDLVTWSPDRFETTTETTVTVTASYDHDNDATTAPFTASYDVTVLPRTVTGLSITTPATETSFGVNDPFSADGIVVTASYNVGDAADVTDIATFDPKIGSILTEAGTKTVTISYAEFTAQYDIEVISVATSKDVLSDTTGFSKIGSTSDYIYEHTWYTITWYKNSASSNPAAYDDIRMYAGHTFVFAAKNGAWFNSVEFVCSSTDSKHQGPLTSTTANVDSSAEPDYTVTPKDDNTTFTIGNGGQYRISTITVNFTYPQENLGTLTSVEIATLPAKTAYYGGETADWSGLTITVADSNGLSNTLDFDATGVAVSPANGTTLSTIGTDLVATVSYTLGDVTLSAQFNYTVKEFAGITYTKVTNDTELRLGDRIMLMDDRNYVMGAYGLDSGSSDRFGSLNAYAIADDASTITMDATLESSFGELTIEKGYKSGALALGYGEGFVATAASANAISADCVEDIANWSIVVIDGEALIEGTSVTSTSTETRYLGTSGTWTTWGVYLDTNTQNHSISMYRIAADSDAQVAAFARYMMRWSVENQCIDLYWDAKTTLFTYMDEAARNAFSDIVGDESGSAIEQAKARYDAWARAWGDYETRFDGSVTSGSVGAAFNNEDVTLYATVAAVFGLSALATGFFLVSRRKRA